MTIGHNLTIIGPGAASMTINGANTHEVFAIPGGVTASLSGLTVTNGLAASGSGAAGRH